MFVLLSLPPLWISLVLVRSYDKLGGASEGCHGIRRGAFRVAMCTDSIAATDAVPGPLPWEP